MARRRRIFRRKRKSGTGDAGPEVVTRSSEAPEPDPDGEIDDVDEAVRAAEKRSLEEILALEKDVERAKSEAGALRERLEEAERRATEAESRADEARAHPPEPEPYAIDVESPGAAERLAAALGARDRELEEERRSRTEAIERADRRLAEIEAQARAAAEGIDAAERRLADEAERLRAGKETEERIRAADQERARAEAQRLESEARSGAADWLRKQTKALRREGQREAETKLEAELDAARRQLAAARSAAISAEDQPKPGQ